MQRDSSSRTGVAVTVAVIVVMGALVAAVGEPPPSEPRFEGVAADQSRLQEDMARVQAYAAGQPATWAGIRFENQPTVRIVVAFTGDVERHRRALLALVDHPDRLEVVGARRSRAELARIRAAVEPEVFRPGGPGISLGETFDRLAVSLRADGETLAASLHAMYGDALEITVGGKPYPSAPSEPGDCPRLPAADPWDDVELRLSLQPDRLRPGADGRAALVVRNRSSRRLELETEQPLLASVVERGTDRVVGTYVGVVAGTGLLLRLSPGQETGIDVLVGTAACDGSRYALAPGRYGVRVAFTVREGTATRTLVSPEVPLVIE